MDRSGTTDGVVAYSGARLFEGERAVVNHAVLVKDGMVSDVVPYDSVPQAVTHYREQDCTLLLGLIDIHVHFMRWQGPQFLASGVTTVRDAGNSLKWILDRRGEWEEKRWPRILCLIPLLDGPAPVHEVVGRPCTDLAAAVVAVQETVKAGVDGVKFYVGLPPEWLPAMVKAGHAAGRRVSMHCAGGGALAAARAGADEFFHLAGILTNIWPAAPPGWLDVWGLPEFGRTIDRQRAVADRLRASGITATRRLLTGTRSGEFAQPTPLSSWTCAARHRPWLSGKRFPSIPHLRTSGVVPCMQRKTSLACCWREMCRSLPTVMPPAGRFPRGGVFGASSHCLPEQACLHSRHSAQ